MNTHYILVTLSLLYIPSSSVNINNYFNVFQIRGYNADNGNDGSYHDISTASEKR